MSLRSSAQRRVNGYQLDDRSTGWQGIATSADQCRHRPLLLVAAVAEYESEPSSVC